LKVNKITLSLATAITLATNSQANQIDLGQITITSATKSEQSIQDITSNVTVIRGEELETKHISTILDALKRSSITTSQSGSLGQQSSLFLNGFSSGNTLVLIDGVKYNDPTTTEGQANLEHIMVNDIEKIEIIKGAQSGIYGANAVAGVINIITKKAGDKLKINSNLSYGSYNTKKVNLSLSQKLNDLSYYLGANYISTDGISAQTPNGDDPSLYEDDEYTNKTANIKLGYKISDSDELKLNLTNIDAKVEYDNDPSFFATIKDKANNSDYRLTQKNRLYKLNYKHKFTKDNYINISYAKANFKKEDPNGFTKKFEGFNKDFELDGKVAYKTNSFLLLGLSKNTSEDEVNSKKIDSKGYFVTNSNLFDKLVFTQSLRKDSYDQFESKTTGKLGVKYNFKNDLSLGSNYGTGYKIPSLYEIYDSWAGNSSLKPSSIKSLDLSLNYKDLEITYFDNDIEDEILYSSSTFSYYNETGTSNIKGYNLNYKKNISQSLVSFDYSKYDAQDKDGYQLAKRVKDELKLGVDYFGFQKFLFGTDLNYVGDRVEYNWGTHDISASTGNYSVINIYANYLVKPNITAYLKVDNIGDKLYQEVNGYGTMGRNFNVGLNASF
jgi:vitamin B12 transporter